MIKISKLDDIKNLFVIGFFTSLFFGIIILSAYFIDLGYFPASNLSSIIYLPVMIGLVGFILFAVFVALLGFAPYYWDELLKRHDTCSIIVKKENADSVISSYKNSPVDLSLQSQKSIILWYVGTMLLCIGLFFGAKLLHEYVFILFLILALIGKYWVLLSNEKNLNLEENRKFYCFYSATKIITYSLLPGLSLSWVLEGLFKLGKLDDTLLQILFAIAITVTSSLCLTPPNKWKRSWWTIFVSIISLITFISILGLLTNLSKNIMRRFELGDMKNVSVLVDDTGCAIFKAHKFAVSCSNLDKQQQINGVNILWRANEYYVQNTKNSAIKFTLLEKHILSITIPEKD